MLKLVSWINNNSSTDSTHTGHAVESKDKFSKVIKKRKGMVSCRTRLKHLILSSKTLSLVTTIWVSDSASRTYHKDTIVLLITSRATVSLNKTTALSINLESSFYIIDTQSHHYLYYIQLHNLERSVDKVMPIKL